MDEQGEYGLFVSLKSYMNRSSFLFRVLANCSPDILQDQVWSPVDFYRILACEDNATRHKLHRSTALDQVLLRYIDWRIAVLQGCHDSGILDSRIGPFLRTFPDCFQNFSVGPLFLGLRRNSINPPFIFLGCHTVPE